MQYAKEHKGRPQQWARQVRHDQFDWDLAYRKAAEAVKQGSLQRPK